MHTGFGERFFGSIVVPEGDVKVKVYDPLSVVRDVKGIKRSIDVSRFLLAVEAGAGDRDLEAREPLPQRAEGGIEDVLLAHAWLRMK